MPSERALIGRKQRDRRLALRSEKIHQIILIEFCQRFLEHFRKKLCAVCLHCIDQCLLGSHCVVQLSESFQFLVAFADPRMQRGDFLLRGFACADQLLDCILRIS